MATSAFKSRSKRSSIGGVHDTTAASSSNRRSRSVSRPPSPGRFVNTVRGSAFPEIISLDKDEFFPSKDNDRSRSVSRRRSVINPSSTSAAASPQRRGRSVSRPHSRGVFHDDTGGGRGKKTTTSTCSSASGPRRRSASVAPYQLSDSESEEHLHQPGHHASVKSFSDWNFRNSLLHKPVNPNHQRVLRRSLSQKELSMSCDGYSSHSSVLTDEEARDTHSNKTREMHSNKNGTERTIRAVYSQKKTEHPVGDGVESGLYEVMRQELRHAVEDIKTEIEQGILNVNQSVPHDDSLDSKNSDVREAVSMIRKNYTAKLDQSEKRKRDLLAEIVAEEQRGRELSQIVKELLPDPNNIAIQEKSSFGRKKNERSWMSKCLIDDAEKYFDEFLSNVEDTDISSFDGERSDASSTIGVKKSRDIVLPSVERGTAGFLTRCTSVPIEMDGVVLPWLQWETSNDGSPSLYKSKVPLISEDDSRGSSQGESTTHHLSRNSMNSTPEGGSLSLFSVSNIDSGFGDGGNYLSHSPARKPRKLYFDMDEYLDIERSEEIVFEAWRQRQGISSGALVLCGRSFLEF